MHFPLNTCSIFKGRNKNMAVTRNGLRSMPIEVNCYMMAGRRSEVGVHMKLHETSLCTLI